MTALETSALIVAVAALAAVGAVILVRRFVHVDRDDSENGIVGWLFSGIIVVVAVLLAFVVFSVYDRYSGLRNTTTDEAAQLVVVYRDTEQFPEPHRSQAQAALRTYATVVPTTEWKSHGLLLAHNAPDALNAVWVAYRNRPGFDANGNVEARLHELEHLRHLRHLASEASLPSGFWPLLIGGAVATILASLFFSMNRAIDQMVLTTVLTVILCGTLLLISALNRPFTGSTPISKRPFAHALLGFHAMDLPPAPGTRTP
jgi:hypothetical protein